MASWVKKNIRRIPCTYRPLSCPMLTIILLFVFLSNHLNTLYLHFIFVEFFSFGWMMIVYCVLCILTVYSVYSLEMKKRFLHIETFYQNNEHTKQYKQFVFERSESTTQLLHGQRDHINGINLYNIPIHEFIQWIKPRHDNKSSAKIENENKKNRPKEWHITTSNVVW